MRFAEARETRWAAMLLVAAVAFMGCSGDDGPDAGSDGSVSGGGGFIEEDIYGEEGIAGRGPQGIEEARRMGLRTIYFDFDQSAIKDTARNTLQSNYDILRQAPSVRVELQGNTDDRGSAEYNFALGERRAKSVKDYLVRLGLPASRMTTVSFGEENPAAVGNTEAAWAKNRRVEFSVLP